MPETLLNGFSRSAVEELSRSKGEPPWLLEKRLQAWEVFEKTPAPLGRRGDLGTLRMFSNFRFQELTPYTPASADGTLPAAIQRSLDQALVNQRSGLVVQYNSSVIHTELAPELLTQGVILTDLQTAVREYPELVQQYLLTSCVPFATDKYTALHAAFWSGGIFLYVPKGVEITDPILTQIWVDQPGAATFAHTLIIADEQSSVRFVQELDSDGTDPRASLLTSVSEVYTKAAAHVEFSNLQDLGQNVWHINYKNAIHERDGSTTWVLADLGSKVMLSNIGVELLGNGTAGELVGVFFTDHDQRYSIKTLSHHKALNTNAETLVHGVLTDEARVEFDGMIRIEPGAQYTASFLSDHTLLLSNDCRAESIPGLEIGANQVSASHGATTGKIDEEQLFYLMVRGIPKDEAERIIVQGFFEPVLQRIPLENLRIRLRRSIIQRMRGSFESEADTWVDAQERWEIEGVDEYAVSLSSSTASDDEIKLTEY
ncbi:MAG TPA: Fe-S cluster assembly protein SufD [Ktedonobacteraceae bacterium]